MSGVKKVRETCLDMTLSLSQTIEQNMSASWACKFTNDILDGIRKGDSIKRLNAWIEWYNKHMTDPSTEFQWEERNGALVPAISDTEKT